MVNFNLLLGSAILAATANNFVDAACFDDWLVDPANVAATELSAATSTCCTGLVADATSTIPANITDLAATLVKIDLTACQISGALPVDLPLLTNLAHLDVSNNTITGEISELLFGMDKLTALDISSNLMAGGIPEFGSLDALQRLNLGDNAFVGRLPDSIGNVTTLAELDVSSNQLSGPIPGSMLKLAALEVAKFKNNRFHGPLPAFLDGVVVDVTDADLIYLVDGVTCAAAPQMCSSGEDKCKPDTKLCCTAEEACLGTEEPGPDDTDDTDPAKDDNTGVIIGAVIGVLVAFVVGFLVFKKMNGGQDMGGVRKMVPSAMKVPMNMPKMKPRSGSSMDVERFDENYMPEGADDDESVEAPDIDLENGDGGNFNPFSGKSTETDFSKYYQDGNSNPKSKGSDGAERKVSI